MTGVYALPIPAIRLSVALRGPRMPQQSPVASHAVLSQKVACDSSRLCRCRRDVPCLAQRYNHGYTCDVKTAISIPDEIFEQAERLAKSRGWSRSELYANAVSAFVNSERFLGVRETLDAVYGDHADDSALDPLLATAQARSLAQGKW